MSQSFQVAPFDDYYQFKNRTSDQDVASNDVYVENLIRNNEEANFRPDRPSETAWNPYLGGPLQQAVSGLTSVPADVYYEHDEPRFNTYGTSLSADRGFVFSNWAGVEMFADPNDRNGGHITWMANGKKSWTVRPSAVGPNDQTEIGQRLIPEEPMTMVSVNVLFMCLPRFSIWECRMASRLSTWLTCTSRTTCLLTTSAFGNARRARLAVTPQTTLLPSTSPTTRTSTTTPTLRRGSKQATSRW